MNEHLDRMMAGFEESLAKSEHFYGDCPPPLWSHPYYRDKTWLLDWLNGRGDFANMAPIRYPIIRRFRFDADDDLTPISLNTMTLTKKRAWGPAPWVGIPFHYEWYVGVDQLGRMVAGESWIVHETGLRLYEQMGDVR